MSFIDRMKFVLGLKASQARIAMSVNSVGQPQMTPVNYEGLSKHGYMKNAVVYRCVSYIADACSGIKWEVYGKTRGGESIELENHPLNDLLKRPNPMQSWSSFFGNTVAYYKLNGNSYVEGVGPGENKAPMELWAIRPDKMKVVPAATGYPAAFVFNDNGNTKTFPVDTVSMRAAVLHTKSFNPINNWYGMSPLEAALIQMDTYNSGNKWNLALLQNSAVPSGVLTVKAHDANPTGTLTEKQFSNLRSEFDQVYSGASNAGRPLLLEGGLEWTQTMLSPKDMEFLNSKDVSAKDICSVYGVPPELLGLGQKTFNNYEEARLSFYEEIVLPTMDLFVGEFNNWLAPFYPGIELKYDKDDIEALQYKREKKFISIKDATFLTQNEKRQAIGYEPIEGWDVFIINGQPMTTPEDSYEETQPVPEIPEPEPAATPAKPMPEAEDEDSEEKGWKSINLVNNIEKQTSWKRQNARRKQLEKAFSKDLESDFEEMYSDIVKSIENVKDYRLFEYAVTKQIDQNMESFRKTIQRHIKYTVNEFGDAIVKEAKSAFNLLELKGTRQFEYWANDYIKTRTGEAITQIEGTTKKRVLKTVKRVVDQAITEGLSGYDVAKELQMELPISAGRARTIAKTEVSMASNTANIEAVRSLEIPGIVKEWVSVIDSRSRDGEGDQPNHVEMNGVTAKLDQKFTVPPDASMDGPGDDAGGPEHVCNCRCVLVFTQAGE